MFKKTIESFNVACDEILVANETMQNKASNGIILCNKTLTNLKEIVDKKDFNTVPEEIDFFKNIKPVPMSLLIYFTEVRSCELRMPKAGNSYKVQFFQKELRKINKFFYKNTDFVHYMEQGNCYLDHQFFTRNHRDNFPFTPMTDYYQFPEFSTSQDMLWAKVKAMYRFIHYIRQALKRLKVDDSEIFEEKRHKILVWTGPKTALAELIYALYSNGAINHGAADINMITASFEDFFNIKLDNIYKAYTELKARKSSKTKFLEELTLNLQQKMSREDQS
ncbi:RteC domain-containing protein [Flavobacterium taihuense]|uniref:RteC domain-containing protein n=1 Tax=Flavobacterium taihuense TaxID=2857508 RepID=A0ABS6XSM1_9FLAO|nr:RteC domain-containing protein [Flavobacterium taihuense]MBW4359347.1 RteC domain-containing protein [Flavobacterium taihuense]